MTQPHTLTKFLYFWLEIYQLRLETLATSFLHALIHSFDKRFLNYCSEAWGYII